MTSICTHEHAYFGCDGCRDRVRRKYHSFPLQAFGPPGPTHIPWEVAERAWATYSALYGRDQSVERLAERGGFSWGEMDSFFPGWREATDEWRKLSEENTRLKARVRELETMLTEEHE